MSIDAGLRRAPRRWHRVVRWTLFTLVAYVATAYVLLPAIWSWVERRHPALNAPPGVTSTASGIPGDPLNVALIGSAADLKAGMLAAGWREADPLSLRSDLKIASDTVTDRPYDDAPVSTLYLDGRREDIAFERPVGHSPRQRHHVRFWRSTELDERERPLWWGAVTFDERVGFSERTGQITHHIAPDVDTERDRLFAELRRANRVADVSTIDDFHAVRSGRNGGSDPWSTDGKLLLGTLIRFR